MLFRSRGLLVFHAFPFAGSLPRKFLPSIARKTKLHQSTRRASFRACRAALASSSFLGISFIFAAIASLRAAFSTIRLVPLSGRRMGTKPRRPGFSQGHSTPARITFFLRVAICRAFMAGLYQRLGKRGFVGLRGQNSFGMVLSADSGSPLAQSGYSYLHSSFMGPNFERTR